MLGRMFVKINVNELFNVSYNQIKTYIIHIESIMNYEIEFEKRVGKSLNSLSL